jgi:mRNA interferase RelE/StbE
MTYQIVIPKPVQKDLNKLPKQEYERVYNKIQSLADNPRPVGVMKMQGYENEYRIRIGDFRIRYEIYDCELVILLLRFGHRKDIYRS